MTLLRFTSILMALAISVTAFALTPVPGTTVIQWKYRVKLPKGSQSGFGRSVAQFGDFALIGAPYEPKNFIGSHGAVYRGHPDRQVQAFAVPNIVTSAEFGSSLAVSGSRVAVGAPTDSVNDRSAGAVYLYDTSANAQNPFTYIPNPTPLSGDYFGDRLAMDSTLLAVCAPNESSGGDYNGVVYLYNPATGDPLTSLSLETTATDQYFGTDVAITSQTIIVGASGADNYAGAVYIYDRFSYAPVRTIDYFGSPAFVGFGSRLAVVGSSLAITAGADGPIPETVYIVDPATGTLLQTLPNPNGTSFSTDFGISLAAVGGRLLVGAPGAEKKPGVAPGAAYLYDVNTGALLLTVTGRKAGDRFGFAVGALDNHLLIGAPGVSKGKGAAYAILAP